MVRPRIRGNVMNGGLKQGSLLLGVMLGLAGNGAVASTAHRPVPIRAVEALTLQSGTMTTSRRASPVSQLTCKGSNCQFAPPAVRCTNAGHDGTDVQWSCAAELDPSVKFGHLSVQCEGFDYPDDPNILAGSCGLEYTLVNTGARSAGSELGGSYYGSGYAQRSVDSDGGGLVGSLLLIGLVCVALSACNGGSHRGPQPCDGYYNGYNYGPRYGRSYHHSGPGFWSGAAAGALGASAVRGRSYRSNGGWGGGGSASHTSTGFATTNRR